jgi:hypothetical protein
MSDTTSTVEMESRPVFHSCWPRANEISFNFNVIDPKLVGYDYG